MPFKFLYDLTDKRNEILILNTLQNKTSSSLCLCHPTPLPDPFMRKLQKQIKTPDSNLLLIACINYDL